ncbi:MAG: hypothetical protein HRU17_02700 [Polyangiaceae bacterium]|nr:hypothetical protein [Polyangiaceae bacterium]
MDPTDAETLSDIRASILEALARFGVAGELYVEPSQAVLHGNGPTVTVPLGDLLGAWTSLPYEGKGRRSTMIARELSNQRRGRGQLPSGDFSNAVSLSASAGTAAVGGHSPTQTSQGQTEHRAGPSPQPHAGAQATRRQDPAQRSPREVALATGGGVLLMVLSLGAYALFDLRYGEGNEGQTDTRTVEQRIAADDRERRERASTVCAKTRSRVMRGATIGPADSEGWVVELSLLREEDGEAMLDAPELTQFFAMNEDGVPRVSWKKVPTLALASGPGTEVRLTDGTLPSPEAKKWHGLKVTFTGRYVRTFFSREKRGNFLLLSNELAKTLGASAAALYARCDGGAQHHIGAWFMGSSPGEATAAMIYNLGAFADIPHLRDDLMRADGGTETDPVRIMTALNKTLIPVKRRKVGALLGTQGGMITGTGQERTMITFPFGDANRASRASRFISRTMGLGTAR